MSALYLLIGVSLAVASGFLCAFIWAVRSGQYEDGFTPSMRILMDDSVEPAPVMPQNTKKVISGEHNGH